MIRDAQARLDALRKLLQGGELSTQEELRLKLEKADFAVTQSTVSRDLKKLGAVRAVNPSGETVYRLPEEGYEPAPPTAAGFANLIRSIKTNGSLIVIHTSVGSASLIARYLDRDWPGGVLGTIAGDDTIFVAPASTEKRKIAETMKAIRESLAPTL